MYLQSEKILNSNISSTCLHNMVNFGRTNGWDRLADPSKFQPVSRLGFVTAPTSLNGGQPNFARCLAVSWAGTLYIHFRGLLPQRNFAWCKTNFASKSFILILAALLHCTTAVGISQTSWYNKWNYRTFAPRHFRFRERKPPLTEFRQLENSLQMEQETHQEMR